MAESGEPRTYPTWLPFAKVAEISRTLKQAGTESTVSPDDARALINSYVHWRDRVKRLLTVLAAEAKCRSCGATIWWVMTKNNKRAPFTVDGVSHFADCPHAASHRGASG